MTNFSNHCCLITTPEHNATTTMLYSGGGVVWGMSSGGLMPNLSLCAKPIFSQDQRNLFYMLPCTRFQHEFISKLGIPPGPSELRLTSLFDINHLYPALDFWWKTFSRRSRDCSIILSLLVIELIVLYGKFKVCNAFSYTQIYLILWTGFCPGLGLLFV